MNAKSKLLRVYDSAPDHLRSKIARTIVAIERSKPEGVYSPLNMEAPSVGDSPLKLLQDNSDSFLALMRTLPKEHKFKKLVADLAKLSSSLKSKLEDTGKELNKLLNADDEDMSGLKVSDLSSLADMISGESANLADIADLSKTLDALSGKVHKEEKSKPVEHSLPSKKVKPESKSDKKDEKSDKKEEGTKDKSSELPKLPDTI